MPMTPNIWTIRFAIYQHFVENARAPSLTEIAAACSITDAQAKEALLALDEVHAIFLAPGTFDIHIANPFSGVPTGFQATVGDRSYQANCAWDCFGIIAALQAPNGTIQANCTENGTPLQLEVKDGAVSNHGAVIHFLVPFSEWYEDMIFT